LRRADYKKIAENESVGGLTIKPQHETEHYRFFFNDNDFIHNQLDFIGSIQEQAYSRVSLLLGHSLNDKIRFNIFADPETVGPINAFCYYPTTIHATFNETIKAVGCHEVAHLMLYDWLKDWPVIQLNEGFSVCCDDWWDGMTLDAWLASRLSVENLDRFHDIIVSEESFNRDHNLSYPAAGIYSQWIIRIKGLESFKKLLRESLTDKEAHKVYLPEWMEELKKGWSTNPLL
jgi:hypothetical protein